VPVYWPGGARRRDDVILICGSCTEREKAGVDTVCPGAGGREGARQRLKPEALSTVATPLADRFVVAVKLLLLGWGWSQGTGSPGVFVSSNQGGSPGRRRRGMPKSQCKSFDIPKQVVWEAYRKVAAKKGARGVDGQSLAEFEADLKNNLYKIWNRMSSGTYFPPPVRAVVIPKPHGGGTRTLGVPTGIANCAVALVSWSFGIVRHGHASVPPVGGAAVAGVVRAADGRGAGIQL
jgi:hypothetical protein